MAEAPSTWQSIVIVESPFGTRPDGTRCTAQEIELNKFYLELCLLDCLQRGEVPLASHKLYTVCLDDTIASERAMGINAGLELHKVADAQAIYHDLGYTKGMNLGIDFFKQTHRGYRAQNYRKLPPELWGRYMAMKAKFSGIDHK